MEEKQINIEIGERMRMVRSIFNEGRKLSAEQFAYLLNETRDRIINYEIGRAAVPLRVLIELYNRGINPIFLLTGEGEIYAKNSAGKNLKDRINEKMARHAPATATNIQKMNIKPEEANFKTKLIKVAAGKISKSTKEF